MRLKYGIAVAGMHGKTTTTSMIAAVLAAAGWIPRLSSEAAWTRWAPMRGWANLSTGGQPDESDRSFLKLSPILAVVTNLDREHMDCYRNMEDVEHPS